ncbi:MULTISPECIES: glycine oxidase ThiO [Paenibacillus]|uniref:glycine oxidase n=1 Tax=Paenibacillus campinasensis TaxID=66347 RepID=A0A268EVJ4_9BACL|nr:glycine oxidase ThiO [Paenibacillus campinasensis]MUG67862.1 glycine oxidase ThiO [Paenibacillus campinasensis]PAD77146.1 glycine oxidase ThiO [Paenibacillus campinasensis]
MNDTIIVMGGGIIGLSCALELRRRGAEVRLLETASCGGQASGAAAGMLAPYSENLEAPDAFFMLCRESLQLYPAWQQQIRELTGMDFEYTACGSLYVAYHEADLLALESRMNWQRDYGSSAVVLQDQELFDAEPGLSRKAIAALLTPEEHHIYAPDFVKALKAACLQEGVRIHEHLDALDLVEWKDRIEVRARSGRAFTGDQLLVCTGAWAGAMSDLLGVRIPVQPIRGQICAYAWGENRTPLNHMVFCSQGYMVQKGNGTLVCGASEDIAGFDSSVTERGIRRLMQWNHKVVPVLEGLKPFHRWAGLRPSTLDGQPLIGRLPHADRVLLAAGHYRNGILLSPVTAMLAADCAEGKPLPAWQQAFRPDRFGTAVTRVDAAGAAHAMRRSCP